MINNLHKRRDPIQWQILGSLHWSLHWSFIIIIKFIGYFVMEFYAKRCYFKYCTLENCNKANTRLQRLNAWCLKTHKNFEFQLQLKMLKVTTAYTISGHRFGFLSLFPFVKNNRRFELLEISEYGCMPFEKISHNKTPYALEIQFEQRVHKNT